MAELTVSALPKGVRKGVSNSFQVGWLLSGGRNNRYFVIMDLVKISIRKKKSIYFIKLPPGPGLDQLADRIRPSGHMSDTPGLRVANLLLPSLAPPTRLDLSRSSPENLRAEMFWPCFEFLEVGVCDDRQSLTPLDPSEC